MQKLGAIGGIVKDRYYQTEARNRTFDYINENPGKHPLIAMPTGTGKSRVISGIINHIVNEWSDVSVLVLSHVKEILEQDHKAISEHTRMDIGLYSSGLGSRSIKKVTVAGIQSIFRRTDEFKHFDFVIIDECHLISQGSNSMYRRFLEEIDAIYLGLTATPYRLGTGYIYGTEDSLFDDLIYDLTSMNSFNKLIEEGFLSKLRTKKTNLELDTDDLHIRGGDFIDSEMSIAFDKKHITNKAIDEICNIGKDYKKWLIFAIDIEHAEHIAENLIMRGVKTGLIHSKMEFDRSEIIKKYKNCDIKCIVNINVLTTGFDDPEIDLIALLRPTNSPVMHVQTIGRGLRIAEGKDHCMILDFAGNTKRLGPINDMHIKKKSKGLEGGGPITKTCPDCDSIHHPTVRVCDVCGHKFEFKTKLTASCDGTMVLASGPTWYNVDKTIYTLKEKENTPDIIKVTYLCGLKKYNEYWCLDHKGYARFVAVNRIKRRKKDIDLSTIDNCIDAMEIVGELETPNRIFIKESGKFPEILRYNFN